MPEDLSEPAESNSRALRVAVIGSGPSGFYAVGALFKSDVPVSVDLFDRLPTPFGLVRGGVAPDHQKIKNVIRVYNKTASDPRFRFFGNVMIGRDLSVKELLEHYDQVVFATGNESDRTLGIPGEDLAGVHSATEFVGWFNGHPDFQDRSFALDRAKRVVVVGNGNVAMDVTRILAQDPDRLADTDITEKSLAMLRKSTVEEIVLLGRRGPAQAAFSPKEIKEIGELKSADLIVDPGEMGLDEVSSRWLEEHAAPSAKKNVAYLTEKSQQPSRQAGRRILCRFLVSPLRLIGEEGRLTAVEIEHNELAADDSGTPRPRATGKTETLAADLIFKAVGYRGLPIPGVPFHERWGILPNDEGRILDAENGSPLPGLYAVGWAKRGPTGLIGTNSPDSQATVQKMLEDAAVMERPLDSEKEPKAIVERLKAKGVDFVTFEDWQRLDAEETRLGEAKGKIREKLTSLDDMMAAVRKLRLST